MLQYFFTKAKLRFAYSCDEGIKRIFAHLIHVKFPIKVFPQKRKGKNSCSKAILFVSSRT